MTSGDLPPASYATAAETADLPIEFTPEVEIGDVVGEGIDSIAPLRSRRTNTGFGFDEPPPSPRGPRRASTGFSSGSQQSKWSSTSSVVPKHWKDQLVLSFDGGGIRGYSSLLILKAVMTAVEAEEKSLKPEMLSSFDPLAYQPCHNNDRRRVTGRSRTSTMVLQSVGPANRAVNTATNSHADTAGGGEIGRSSPGLASQIDEEETCRFLPCHYFDYIGGTSTGGLISIMLGRLRMGIDECLKEYEDLGGRIFNNPRWASIRGPIPALRDKYDGAQLQRMIEEVVARRLPPKQLKVGAGNFNCAKELCRTVVVTYEQKKISDSLEYGDIEGDLGATDVVEPLYTGPYLFRSYDHWGSPWDRNVVERNPGVAHSIPIWQVARATTAAPFYFDPIDIQNRRYGDGGFGTNNPVCELYMEVKAMHGNDPSAIAMVLSIGTGTAGAQIKRYNSGTINKWIGYLTAAKQLASSSEDEHTRMRGFKPRHLHYFRLNVPASTGLGKMKLDEWKAKGGIKRRKTNKTLEKIRQLTNDYLEDPEVQDEIRQIATILVNHRRQRAGETPGSSRRWELYATGVQYRCTYSDCWKSQKLRSCAEDLREHLKREHGFRNAPADELEQMVEKGKCHF